MSSYPDTATDTATAPTPIGRLKPASTSRPGLASLVIGIVAAYPSLRAGLASLIQNDRTLTASAIPAQALGSGSQSLTTLRLSEYDVVLVEPRELAPDMLARLGQLARADGVPLIWLRSSALPAADVHDTVAGGVVAMDVDSDTLVAAIRAVSQGLRVIDPDLIENDGAESDTGGTGQGTFVDGILSPREREVLSLVAAGMPNKAIARSLGISDHTVKFHVSSVLTKLDAGSRTEAVTLATRRGILTL